MNVVDDDTTRGWSIRFFLLLAAAFTIAVGYGVILPVLPFFLERLTAEGGRFSVSWHTGMLTGVYMFARFVFAPMWGYISDRLGRRPVILLGLAGFSATMVLFGLAGNLAIAYFARALGGLFSAAVLPVTLAYVGDTNALAQRARGFAWLSAANAFGSLTGPALAGWLSNARLPTAIAGNMSPAESFALPFLAAAIMGGIVWLGIYFLFSKAVPAPRVEDTSTSAPSNQALTGLLILTLLVTFGHGSFMVVIALLGQQILNLAPSDIGIMFMECSLVMIAVQVLIFLPLVKRLGRHLLAPAFMAMAVGVGLIPYTANYSVLLVLVGLTAVASGLLIPALTYLISFAGGLQQGVALGRQTSVASLGQALGSAVAGVLFGLMMPAPFWLTAGLLVISAGIALITMSRVLFRG
ncbi:MAG: MFS transporter [Pseudomonadota bacterium]